MANTLILNQSQVFNGLGTLTFTVPATGVYNVAVQTTMPASAANGFAAGTGADQGLGVSGGSQGIGQGSNLSLGNGGQGLGFGGTANDGASGVNGHGAGAGGGAEGFTQGDQGTGHGGTGYGFGAGNGYPQPLAYVTTPTVNGAAVTSGLSIVVNDNGSPVYTAPTLGLIQRAQQFKQEFLFTSGHTVTVVFASSTSTDEQLQGITSNVSIGTG